MKRIVTLLSLVLALPAFAQTYHQDDANSSMLVFPLVDTRTEIIVPPVNGYNVIKADLHNHTIYSDGSITPQARLLEAWRDGMDAIAITDHLEYRPNEKRFEAFLSGLVTVNKTDPDDIKSDQNYAGKSAASGARRHGITLIHGAEITRDAVSVGHFNLLFTTDNNLIPDPDPIQAIRNAKAQGAIVQCNHPGWRRQDNNFTAVADAALKEGLIDGVEVFNTNEFYPDVIERAVEKGLYISSCTDIHGVSDESYAQYNVYRNMTLLLAEDNSPEAIRDALTHQRTLAYSYGNIAGSEALLKDFFNACVGIDLYYTDSKGYKYVKMTNKSSFPFTLDITGMYHGIVVPKLSTITFRAPSDILDIVICNMWYGADKHPVVNKSF